MYYVRNEYNITLIPGANIQSVEGQGNSGIGNGVQLQEVIGAPVPGTVRAAFKFGQNVDINSVLQIQTGYTITFEQWESNNTGLIPNNTNQNASITIPKGDVTLTAVATKIINNYEYTVEYYYDNLIDDTKTVAQSAEFASVITYPSAQAPEKLIIGYELDTTKGTNGVEGSPLTITEIEENNIIKVYYKEIIYSIDYELNGGELEIGNTNPSTYTVNSENITLINPVRQGYTFTGWTLTELGGVAQTPGTPDTTTVITKGSIQNRKYTANWQANTDTAYKVEHYQENIDGSYTLFETENLVGETNTTATATPKSYDGYTENTTHAQRVAIGTITSDGNLVLKLYYSRQTYRLTLIAGTNTTTVSNSETTGTTVEKYYKHGEQINIIATLGSEQGYTYNFIRWTSNDPDILTNQANINAIIGMPKGDVTLTATATRTLNNYNYTVEYYYNNVIDNTKTVNSTAQFASNVTYPSTKAPNKLITGYELERYESNGLQSVPLTITANPANNIMKVYYKEIIYTINYVLDGGELEEGLTNPETYTINTENITLNNPIREGFSFTGWTLTKLNGILQIPGEPNTSIVITKGTIQNREYTANWLANTDTAYKIEHYQENIDGSYTLFETENQVGETNTTATATPKTYNGYIENTTHAERTATGTISPDGNLVLKLYYSRQEYKITLIPGANIQSVEGQGTTGLGDGIQLQEVVGAPVTGTIEATFKFGQNININSVLQTETGYTFAFIRWTSSNTGLLSNNTNKTTSITMPKGDITLTASASKTPNQYNYSIEYYYNEIKDDARTTILQSAYLSAITTANISSRITTNTKTGYEIDLTKGTNGVEGTPLTISTIPENNIIKVYYKEITYSIDYELNGGNLELGDTNPSTYTVNTENITLNNPVREGYTFTGWTLTELGGVVQTPGAPSTTTVITKGSIQNREYTANWQANTDTEYKIEHYQENIDGTYSLFETESLVGETNTIAVATPKTYDGYTENTTHSERISSGTISPDGNLVLKMYYIRQEYKVTLVPGANIQTVEGQGTAGLGNGIVLQEVVGAPVPGTKEATFKFGQIININAIMQTETGYNFSFVRWTSNNTGLLPNNSNRNANITMPKGDITLTPSATKTAANFGYSVEYYYDNILDNTKTVTSTSQFATQVISYPDKVITGYEFDKVENLPLLISADPAQNIIKVYYKLINYTITYNLDGGSLEEGVTNPLTYTVKDTNITLNNPTKEAYIFSGWTGSNGVTAQTLVTINTQDAQNKTYTANWEQTEYKLIIHHYEELTTNSVSPDEEITGTFGKSYKATSLINNTNKLFVDEVEINTTRNYLNPLMYNYVSVSYNNLTQTLSGTEITGNFNTDVITEITYYYSVNKYQITGEIVGGNGSFEQDITETVIYGNSSTKTIKLVPNIDYRVQSIRIYTGAEVDGSYDETNGTPIVGFDEDSLNQVTMPMFTNVTQAKHIVVKFELAPMVAQIISVPVGSETMQNISGQTILNNQYKSLEQAIEDAKLANINEGIVEIRLLGNIRNESIIIEDDNNVIIDLNGYSIRSYNETPVLTVNSAELVVKDTSLLQTGQIISTKTAAIWITPVGEFTLGEDNSTITLSPYIEGIEYGVYKEIDPDIHTEGIFNFYDGRIVAQVAISGIVNDTPALYNAAVTTGSGNQIGSLVVISGVEGLIGKKTYSTIEQAIFEANTIYGSLGQPVEVDMVVNCEVNEALLIQSGRNITLDLNGKVLNTTASTHVIKNSGNLTIIDSTTGEYDLDVLTYSTNFKKEEYKLISQNTAINTSSRECIILDLTQETGMVELKINAEISTRTIDFGYALISEDRLDKSYSATNNNLIAINGIVAPQDYIKQLEGGKKYFLHIGYFKPNNSATLVGENKFTINSIKINDVAKKVGNSYDYLNLNGKITSSKANTILNNSGSTFILNSGIIECTKSSSYCIENNGNTIINNGLITGGTVARGIYNNTLANLTQNNGSIIGNTYGIYNIGNTEINEGTYKVNSGNAIYTQQSGYTVINNGHFYSEISNYTTSTIAPGTIINNGDINSLRSATGVVNIYNTNAKQYTSINNNAKLEIFGGKYLIIQNNYNLLNIYGGEISNNTVCIENRYGGIVNITGTTISTTSTSVEAIRNFNSGSYLSIFNIDNCVINSDGIGINNEGKAVIKNSLINISNKKTGAIGITNTGGYVSEILIEQGTEINNQSVGGIGISDTNTNLGSAITIGVKDGNVSLNNPKINTLDTAISSLGTQVNMYDGVLVGKPGRTLNTSFNELETNKEITKETKIDGLEYITLITQTAEIARISKTFEIVGTKYSNQDDNYYYFTNLNNAIESCSTTATDETIIQILQDNLQIATKIVINSGQNIKLDLNGKTVRTYNYETIQNNGTFTLTDSDTTPKVRINNNYYFEKEGAYIKSNNEGISSSASNSYIKIDLTDKLPQDLIPVSITAAINSGSGNYGFATIKNNTLPPLYNDTVGRFMYISGTTSGTYSTNLAGGQIYYLHLGYYKSSIHTLSDNLKISDIKVNGINALPELKEEGNIVYMNRTFIKNNGVANINNGTYICKTNATSSYYYDNIINNSILNISGGKIIGGEYTKVIVNNIGGVINTTGGIIDCGRSKFSYGIYNLSSNEITLRNIEIIANSILSNQSTGKVNFENSKGRGVSSDIICITNISTGEINIKNTEIITSTDYYNGYSISNNSSGIINIESCNITMSNSSNILNSIATGIINIKLSTITNNYAGNVSSGSCIENKGQLNIETSNIYQNGANRGPIYQTGTTAITTVLSGNIIGTSTQGIRIDQGTLVIGQKSGDLIQTDPLISGTTYGLNITAGSIVKFYDGIIKGPTVASIFGTITEIEEGYEIIKTQNASIESAFLDNLPIAKLVSTNTEYESIQQAVDATQDNTEETIEIIRTSIISSTSPSINIAEGKNIKLDLKGYEIKASNVDTIINSGTLEILSTQRVENSVVVAAEGIGKIINYTDNFLYNTLDAQFTLSSGSVEMNGVGTSTVYKNLIKNNGNIYIEGGNLRTTKEYTNVIFSLDNAGNVYINNGTLESLSPSSNVRNILNNGNIYVSGGLIKGNNTNGIKTSGIVKVTGGSIDVGKSGVILEPASTTGIEFTGGTIKGTEYSINSDNTNVINISNILLGQVLNDSTGVLNIIGNAQITGVVTNYNTLGIINIIDNAQITGRLYNRTTGTINIDSENVIINNTETFSEVINNNGTGIVNIRKGKIYQRPTSSSVTIRNYSTGTINIGVKDGIVNNNSVIITNDNSNAIENKQGTINYYEGTITSVETIKGQFTEIETGYEIVATKNTTTETVIISNTTDVASITIGETTTMYNTLKDAITASIDNQNTTIKMLKSIIIVPETMVNISINKDIKLDINGKEIRCYSSQGSIYNSGKLEIIDSLEVNGTGAIRGFGSNIITNENELKISSGKINGISSIEQKVIINTGKLNMSGGKIVGMSGFSERIYCIYSSSKNIMNLTGGIIEIVTPGSTSYFGLYLDNPDTINKQIVNIAGIQFSGITNAGQYATSYGIYNNSGTKIIMTSGNINSGDYGIYNKDEVELSGGSIYGNSNSGIYNANLLSKSTLKGTGSILSSTGVRNGGTFTMESGIITSTSTAIYNGLNSGSITTILGGEVKTTSTSTSTACITNGSSSTLVVLGGKITNDYGHGISNTYSSATTILGQKDYPVSKISPEIIAGNYGINKTNGQFKFYDGIVKGGVQAIFGTADDTPILYSVQTENNNKTAYLAIQGTFTQVAKVNSIYFDSLQEAVNATSTGTIILQKNIVVSAPVTIAAGKNITLDLNAQTLSSAIEGGLIINNGTLTIIDSQEDGSSTVEYGIIENYDDIAIVNNSILSIGVNDTNVYTNSPRILGGKYAVSNLAGTFNYYDGILKGVTSAIEGTITQITNKPGYTVKDGTETINELVYLTKYLGI